MICFIFIVQGGEKQGLGRLRIMGRKRFEFVGLAYQGKDIVFRFIIEYSSLMDFGPLVIALVL
jgi:hypothetical protein